MNVHLVQVGCDHLLGGEHALIEVSIEVQVWPQVVRAWDGV